MWQCSLNRVRQRFLSKGRELGRRHQRDAFRLRHGGARRQYRWWCPYQYGNLLMTHCRRFLSRGAGAGQLDPGRSRTCEMARKSAICTASESLIWRLPFIMRDTAAGGGGHARWAALWQGRRLQRPGIRHLARARSPAGACRHDRARSAGRRLHAARPNRSAAQCDRDTNPRDPHKRPSAAPTGIDWTRLSVEDHEEMLILAELRE